MSKAGQRSIHFDFEVLEGGVFHPRCRQEVKRRLPKCDGKEVQFSLHASQQN